MSSAIAEIIAQYGVMGILICAAAYIFWDSWKRNKSRDEFFEKKFLKNTDVSDIKKGISDISNEIGTIKQDNQLIHSELSHLEDSIFNSDTEHKFGIITEASQDIYTTFDKYIKTSGADHVALALFHNGVKSLSGVPFVRYSVISERFKPMTNPNDEDLVSLYTARDIMSHDRLPLVLSNKNILYFHIHDGCKLEEVDVTLWARCMKRGIKHIAMGLIKSSISTPVGVVAAYSFGDILDDECFREVTSEVSNIYRAIEPKMK